MKNSKLFSCIGDILFIKSKFSSFVAFCICQALADGIASFYIAFPVEEAMPFAGKLDSVLHCSPIIVTRTDEIPDVEDSVLFLYGVIENPFYIRFEIFS